MTGCRSGVGGLVNKLKILFRLAILAGEGDGGFLEKSVSILKVVDCTTSTPESFVSDAKVTFLFPLDGFCLELLENLLTL